MIEPTDGCPDCGTIDSRHAEDCEYLTRQARAAAEDAAVIAEEAAAQEAHPYPHRAWCGYCNKTIEKAAADSYWFSATPLGRDLECRDAPLVEGELPGPHEPVKVLSVNGPVPDGAR